MKIQQNPETKSSPRLWRIRLLIWTLSSMLILMAICMSILHAMLSTDGNQQPTTIDYIFCNLILFMTGIAGRVFSLVMGMLSFLAAGLCRYLYKISWGKTVLAGLSPFFLAIILCMSAGIVLALGGAGNACLAD